jgi:SRSO17 transposase
VANHAASLPIAYRLYLPKEWVNDSARRDMAGVPEAIAFVTKSEIALAQIETALRDGVPQGVVLMDAGYGTDTGLRTAISALGLPYVAGIQSTTTLWPPGKGPLPPSPGLAAVGRPRAPGGMQSTSRFRPRPSPSACRPRPGRRLPGVRDRPIG